MMVPLASSIGSLLHACGDVSRCGSWCQRWSPFAPRMWRCFFIFRRPHYGKDVCSTHVEMFLASRSARSRLTGLLHACGDVSRRAFPCPALPVFAPRMWRCFPVIASCGAFCLVCSTHVEMFLTAMALFKDSGRFAPRMWRCFPSSPFLYSAISVCSTHVEMFPTSQPLDSTTRSLLHACGDVSLPIS